MTSTERPAVRLKLRFPTHRIPHWSRQYVYNMDERVPVAVGAFARQHGYLGKSEFLKIARWKTPRSQSRCASNPPAFVREVTRVAFSTTDERLAIEVLTLLDGVSWPTASVILHFCSDRRYPILDFRALWSLSSDAKPADHDFTLWHEYVAITRKLATAARVSMRTLDQALWAYSKEKQPVATKAPRMRSHPGAPAAT